MDNLHQLNTALHTIFATLALLVGLGPLPTAKGGAAPRRLGRWFLGLTVVGPATRQGWVWPCSASALF